MKQRAPLLAFLLLLGALFLFGVTSIAAEGMYEEVSTEDMLYLRGLISKVDTDKMQISVRPPKGKRIRITIDPDTLLEGVSQIDEFKKEQQVKVWYSIDNDTNRAIKIKKMMELGC